MGGLAVVLSLLVLASAARAENLSDCHAAERAQNAGRLDAAIDGWSRCIEWGDLSPGYLNAATVNRGNARADQGDYARALSDYDEAIGRDPEFLPAHNGRCWVYALMRRPHDALEACNACLDLRPDFPFALDSRALAYWLLGSRDEARRDLERARRVDPSRPAWQQRFRQFEVLFGEPAI